MSDETEQSEQTIEEIMEEQRLLDYKKASREAPKIAEALNLLNTEGEALKAKLAAIHNSTFEGATKQALANFHAQFDFCRNNILADGRRVDAILNPPVDYNQPPPSE